MILPTSIILQVVLFLSNVNSAPISLPLARKNISIPISKRGSLTRADGTADFELVKKHAAYIQDKYTRNEHALRRNIGTGQQLTERALTGSVPLTNFNNNLLWAGKAKVGTPGTDFTVCFDTGSSDLVLPSVDCASLSCIKKVRYDPSKSTTATQQTSDTFSIHYGDGSSMTGTVYNDTVTVAGFTATNQAVGVAQELSTTFASEPEDGILGLGWQSISQTGSSPFFQTLVDQKAIDNAQFSFYIAPDNSSELYLGGINTALVLGELEWHPISAKTYWTVPTAPLVNGRAILNDTVNGIVDTGTSVVVGPPDEVAVLWAGIEGATEYQNGYYSYPCNATEEISFNFAVGGKQWAMSSSSLNLGKLDTGECLGSVIGQTTGINGWILGDSLLMNMYTTFDYDNARVGFGQLRGKQRSSIGSIVSIPETSEIIVV